jgi:hypothetical protein
MSAPAVVSRPRLDIAGAGVPLPFRQAAGLHRGRRPRHRRSRRTVTVGARCALGYARPSAVAGVEAMAQRVIGLRTARGRSGLERASDAAAGIRRPVRGAIVTLLASVGHSIAADCMGRLDSRHAQPEQRQYPCRQRQLVTQATHLPAPFVPEPIGSTPIPSASTHHIGAFYPIFPR